jgi:hypothetical protein
MNFAACSPIRAPEREPEFDGAPSAGGTVRRFPRKVVPEPNKR